MNCDFRYSVLMSIYDKVDCGELKIAVDSMLNQTLPPAEFVIVKDGPLTEELERLLERYSEKYWGLFKFAVLKKNCGLGTAYAKGVKLCSCDYIAVMDSDDYSVPDRCRLEARYFIKHPETDIVGSSVYEFCKSTDNVIALRSMPRTHEQCVRFAKKRCPCAHPSTMLRKSALIKAGGYRKCMFAEDYDLYVRMIMCGCIFYNLQIPLVYVRVSDDFYSRRSGVEYLKNIISCKKNFYDMGFYSLFDLIRGIAVHSVVCLVPDRLRTLIYMKLLRKSAERTSKR